MIDLFETAKRSQAFCDQATLAFVLISAGSPFKDGVSYA